MKITGISILITGILLIIFSGKIVFPGLELLLGIETIVGAESVIYNDPNDPSKGYMFTNPGAMMSWVFSVTLIGIITTIVGISLLILSKRKQKNQKQV